MRLLAETFPGSILVFATMKDGKDLSKDEINRIRRIAYWGREYNKERNQIRAPVIVLTGTELFTAHYLQESWKTKGGKHEQIAAISSIGLDNLRTLADITQQLYLDMPSHSSWMQAKWKKREEIRKRRQSIKNAKNLPPTFT